jgi:hypothetical protein
VDLVIRFRSERRGGRQDDEQGSGESGAESRDRNQTPRV